MENVRVIAYRTLPYCPVLMGLLTQAYFLFLTKENKNKSQSHWKIWQVSKKSKDSEHIRAEIQEWYVSNALWKVKSLVKAYILKQLLISH